MANDPAILPSRPRQRILFMPSNGGGMGHVTRMLAVARRAPERVEPVFAALSREIALIERHGFRSEHVPHPRAWHYSDWHRFLERRLLHVAELYGPAAIVYDGTVPHLGLLAAAARLPGCRFVWMRRAMWRKGRGRRYVRRARYFDLVIEPGELAKRRDAGATVAQREQVTHVKPIVLLDEHELRSRAEARAALGIEGDGRMALVLLGAGPRPSLGSALTLACGGLRRAGYEVAVAEWLVRTQDIELPGVRRLREYPIGRNLRAFDVVVSAAGYNSFHELVACAVPTIMVPMLKLTDDQFARAAYARDEGFALVIEEPSAEAFDACLASLEHAAFREGMVRRCREVFPGNGAAAAMDAIVALAAREPEAEAGAGVRVGPGARCLRGSRRLERVLAARAVVTNPLLKRLSEGRDHLQQRAVDGRAPVVMIDARGLEAGAVRPLLRAFEERDGAMRACPLLVFDDPRLLGDPAIDRYLYELVPKPADGRCAEAGAVPADGRRMEALGIEYRAARTVSLRDEGVEGVAGALVASKG